MGNNQSASSEQTNQLNELNRKIECMNRDLLASVVEKKFKKQLHELKKQLVSTKFSNVMSGKDFKKMMNAEDKFFIRFMNDDMTHHNFVYKEGLNEDTVPFNPRGNCENGGLYFTTHNHIKLFMNFDGSGHLRLVGIPDDAQVYVVPGNKWKADKIIIGDKIESSVFDVFDKVKDIEGFFDEE